MNGARIGGILLGATLFVLAAPALHAAPEIRSIQNEGEWNLSGYIGLAASDPDRLISIVEEQFLPEVRKKASTSPEMAYAWQDRVALVGALTEFFNPDAKIKASGKQLTAYRKKAQDLIGRTMIEDPALLVRDGAVEAIRRVIRMRPGDARAWKKILETGFMDRKNVLDGEGLFIRETILTAIREASLPLDNRIRKAAELDQNPKVRGLLGMWSTRAFDSL
jgi:hypothetical protein